MIRTARAGLGLAGGLLAMAASLAGAMPASAQRLPYPMPYARPPAYPPPGAYPDDPSPYIAYVPPPVDDRVFGGVRVEAHIAYDRLLADLPPDVPFAPGSRSGFGYGGEVGVDVPLAGGALLLGGYAGADGSTIRECQALSGGGRLCLTPGRSLVAGGRLGVRVGRGTLLYAKGGYSNDRLILKRTDPDPSERFDVRRNIGGFHVGGGVEQLLGPRAYGKLEYVYTRLNGADDDGDDAIGADFDRHRVQAGLGLRF